MEEVRSSILLSSTASQPQCAIQCAIAAEIAHWLPARERCPLKVPVRCRSFSPPGQNLLVSVPPGLALAKPTRSPERFEPRRLRKSGCLLPMSLRSATCRAQVRVRAVRGVCPRSWGDLERTRDAVMVEGVTLGKIEAKRIERRRLDLTEVFYKIEWLAVDARSFFHRSRSTRSIYRDLATLEAVGAISRRRAKRGTYIKVLMTEATSNVLTTPESAPEHHLGRAVAEQVAELVADTLVPPDNRPTTTSSGPRRAATRITAISKHLHRAATTTSCSPRDATSARWIRPTCSTSGSRR